MQANFFTHQRPIVRYNQFGATIGGPIIKNKTFFFFGYQGTRDFGTSVYTNFTVPLPEFKNGDFSSVLGTSAGTDVLGRSVLRFQIFDPLTTRTVKNAAGQDVVLRDPFLGNRIPASRFSPAALKIQALYPDPQINTPFSNYNSAGSRGTSTKNYDFKGDHNFTVNDKLMLRYAKKYSDAVGSQPFSNPLAGGDTYTTLINPAHTATANYVHLFGARATNDLHLGWFEQFPKRLSAGSNLAGSKDFGINGLPNGDNKLLGTPNFTLTNFSRLGSTPDNLFFENQSSRSLVNQTSIVLSRHTLKFGGEARKVLTDNLQPNPGNTQWQFSNLFTDQRGVGTSGFDYASFLLGLPRSLTYFIYPDYFRTRGSIYALFVQDDIRVSRKLTLNIGLRWDAPLWFHEKLNRTGVFDIDKGVYNQLGTNGFRDTPWQQDWKNFGPRFGFAYSPFGRDKTVIRGGYGLFSVGTSRSLRESFMELSPLFAEADGGKYTSTDSVNWRTTLDNVPFTPSGKTGAGYLAVNIYPDKNPMAYVQQWNTNVSHEFRGVLVEVGYAGSHGVHLPIGNNAIGGYNVNTIPLRLATQARGQFIAPYVTYPQYPNGVTVRTWIGNSIYHSLQTKVEKRFGGGFGVLAAYTWQKTIASEDGNFRDPVANRRMDRGLEGNSVPQRLSVAWNYELPFGKGRKWLTGGPLVYPLGGWEINGITTLQSGFPLTPGESFNSAQNGGTSRPNALRDPALAPSERTLARWFDVSAFALPAQYTVGNSGRGLIYGPGIQSVNLSIGGKGNEPGKFLIFEPPAFRERGERWGGRPPRPDPTPGTRGNRR